MIALVPTAKVRRALLYVAPLLFSAPFLIGCETQGYDPSLRYGPRTDPILIDVPTDETEVPDRPGQLPLVSLQPFAEFSFPDAKNEEALKSAKSAEQGNPLYLLGLYYDINKDKRLDLNDTKKLPGKARNQLTSQLYQLFGSPAAPRVTGIEAVTLADDTKISSDKLLDALQLDHKTLAKGSKLYRIHCLHCHGLTGDGRGPTAAWVNPHPRHYRLGTFKFLSSNMPQNVQQKPRLADLLRVLKEGIDGSSMPAFNVLPDDEREALASYVIHLSLRGETEMKVLRQIMTGELEPGQAADAAITALEETGGNWYTASQPKSELIPEKFPFDPANDEEMKASVHRGYRFFTDEKDGCFKCHKDFGRASTFRFDGWGTMVRPRDLSAGIYRGGRRPLDLYWRVSLGINNASAPGTMTAFGSTLKKGGNKYDATVWDVVNFVQILPYPAMRSKYDVPNID